MRLTRKQWLRQLGQDAIEDAEDFGDVVQRLPTFVPMKCQNCGHRGSAQLPFGRKHRVTLKCSRCGTTETRL